MPVLYFNFVCIVVAFSVENKSFKNPVQLAIKFDILLDFQILQEVNSIFKMSASICSLELRVYAFDVIQFLFSSDFDQIGIKMPALTTHFILCTLIINIAVPFKPIP